MGEKFNWEKKKQIGLCFIREVIVFDSGNLEVTLGSSSGILKAYSTICDIKLN